MYNILSFYTNVKFCLLSVDVKPKKRVNTAKDTQVEGEPMSVSQCPLRQLLSKKC